LDDLIDNERNVTLANDIDEKKSVLKNAILEMKTTVTQMETRMTQMTEVIRQQHRANITTELQDEVQRQLSGKFTKAAEFLGSPTPSVLHGE
jgi:hypothetical protein